MPHEQDGKPRSGCDAPLNTFDALAAQNSGDFPFVCHGRMRCNPLAAKFSIATANSAGRGGSRPGIIHLVAHSCIQRLEAPGQLYTLVVPCNEGQDPTVAKYHCGIEQVCAPEKKEGDIASLFICIILHGCWGMAKNLFRTNYVKSFSANICRQTHTNTGNQHQGTSAPSTMAWAARAL
jgi:hypothetical protein